MKKLFFFACFCISFYVFLLLPLVDCEMHGLNHNLTIQVVSKICTVEFFIFFLIYWNTFYITFVIALKLLMQLQCK